MSEPTPFPPSFATKIGAIPQVAESCLTVYIPNKDKHSIEFGKQRVWVLELVRLLSEINGGATSFPVEGGWLSEEKTIILENPVVVYSFITNADRFEENIPVLREFLHRMGRETNQGEIGLELNNEFFRIREFDAPNKEEGKP